MRITSGISSPPECRPAAPGRTARPGTTPWRRFATRTARPHQASDQSDQQLDARKGRPAGARTSAKATSRSPSRTGTRRSRSRTAGSSRRAGSSRGSLRRARRDQPQAATTKTDTTARPRRADRLGCARVRVDVSDVIAAVRHRPLRRGHHGSRRRRSGRSRSRSSRRRSRARCSSPRRSGSRADPRQLVDDDEQTRNTSTPISAYSIEPKKTPV